MIFLLITTVLAAIGQCVIAWILTAELWLKSRHPVLAGVVQALGVWGLIYVVGSIVSLGLAAVFLLLFSLDGVSDGVLQAVSDGGLLWGLSVLSLAPYIFVLLRVIRLIRRGVATRRWQQGGS